MSSSVTIRSWLPLAVTLGDGLFACWLPFAEHSGQERHAYVHAVLGLAEVGGTGVRVHVATETEMEVRFRVRFRNGGIQRVSKETTNKTWTKLGQTQTIQTRTGEPIHTSRLKTIFTF